MKLFTVCLNYADFLALTLPEWQKYGEVHVITSIEDNETLRLCELCGVRHCISYMWGPTGVNKGAVMNDQIPKYLREGEQAIIFDADTFPRGILKPRLINPDEIFGCRRVACRTPEEFALRRNLTWDQLRWLPVPPYTDRPNLIRGYFQWFVYQDRLRFGKERHQTFSGCDLFFASRFAYNIYLEMEEFFVYHLGQHGKNWKGRVTPRWQP